MRHRISGLRTILTLCFALTALLCAATVGILSNLQLTRQFRDYVEEERESRMREIAAMTATRLAASTEPDLTALEQIGVQAMERGFILKILDTSGHVLWNAYTYNEGLCHQMLTDMSRDMRVSDPAWDGTFPGRTIPLANRGEAVGSIEIEQYAPYYFSEADHHFLRTLNTILSLAASFSLLASLGLGILLSRAISRPLSLVAATARTLDGRARRSRAGASSGIREIDQLVMTLNQAADALDAQDALRARLTGDVAHELRTPLATLQTHLEAMIDKIWEPTTERLESCHEEILRLSRLVGDLEKLARYDADALPLDKTILPAEDFLRRLLVHHEPEYARKRIKVELSCQALHFHADRDKWSQVIVNLLSNAIKYTPEGGAITIRTWERDGLTHLSVTDTGIGIPAKDLPHIFERLYRADPSRSRLTGGSGIGLALVRTIVAAHGGRVTVDSVPGAGSTFTVSIPQAPSDS